MINRILIVGFGSAGKRHFRLARQLFPRSKIAVLRRDSDLSSDLPEEPCQIFSTMTEVLKFAPQIAVLANPATFHLSVAMPLAERGIHLLIEKPLAIKSKGVKSLIEVCEKTNAVLAIGYNLRFLQSLQKFKSMLDDQIIGDVWSVNCEVGQYLPSWRPDIDYRKSVSAQNALGGGALLELSHEIDYLRWIFGEVYSVQALLTKQSDLQIDVEDSAHLILEFVAKNHNKRPLIAAVSLDFIRQNTTRLCTVIGKLGSLRWNGIIGTVELWSLNSQCWQEIYKEYALSDASYIAEWQNFIVCIKEGSKPLITGEEGLNVLQIIDAAILAAKIKSQVKVDSINELQEL